MFGKDALIQLQEGGSIAQAQNAVSVAPHEDGVVALPSDYKLHDLEKFMPRPRRAHGLMQTRRINDFAEYVTARAMPGATVFINGVTATAVLNLGTLDAPGHADDAATLKLEPTPEYDALRGVDGKQLDQQQLAEFMEDWTSCIACYRDDRHLDPGHAITAVRNMTIKALRETESTVAQLSANRSALESISADSRSNTLPTWIMFTCTPFDELGARTFSMRVSVRTGGDAPALVLRIANKGTHIAEMEQEFMKQVGAALDEEAGADAPPMVLGSYSR